MGEDDWMTESHRESLGTASLSKLACKIYDLRVYNFYIKQDSYYGHFIYVNTSVYYRMFIAYTNVICQFNIWLGIHYMTVVM